MKNTFLIIILCLIGSGCYNHMMSEEVEEIPDYSGDYWTCSDSWVHYFTEYQCEELSECPENGEECVYSGD